MSGTLRVSEDTVYATVWDLIAGLFDTATQGLIFKGFQNITSTPGQDGPSYIVISPGVKVRTSQGSRSYDPTAGTITVDRNTTYYYQVDAFGPLAPDYADIVTVAWNSMYAATATADAGAPFQVLYADEPTQLNFTNGELQYEQRFSTKLYLQVNQAVTLPQQFADQATIVVNPPLHSPPDLWPDA